MPGDFYVAADCCTLCDVPRSCAPTLFDIVEEQHEGIPGTLPHCYVKRQPQTPAETAQMLYAVRLSELQCIRYRGTDRLLQLTLADHGCAHLCDQLAPDLQPLAEAAQRLEALRDPQLPSAAVKRPWWRFW